MTIKINNMKSVNLRSIFAVVVVLIMTMTSCVKVEDPSNIGGGNVDQTLLVNKRWKPVGPDNYDQNDYWYFNTDGTMSRFNESQTHDWAWVTPTSIKIDFNNPIGQSWYTATYEVSELSGLTFKMSSPTHNVEFITQ